MKTIPLHALYSPPVKRATQSQVAAPGKDFKKSLNHQMGTGTPIQLTKHAQDRLKQRNIQFTENKWQRIHDKLQEAKGKGLKDSLVLTKEAALIVNVDKNTVITALGRNEAASHIFTNINGTILVDD